MDVRPVIYSVYRNYKLQMLSAYVSRLPRSPISSPSSVHASFQVTAAVSQVGNPERVWKKNVETMRGLGAETMQRTVDACMKPPKEPNHQGKTRS